jgi:hypothetical protein
MSKVDDLITLEEARERVHKRREWVREFARATGTVHEPTGKIIWPEFERAFMAQRKKPRYRQQPTPSGPLHPGVTC